MLALQILGMRGRRRKSGAAYLSTRTRKRPRGQTILTQECLLGSIVLTQKGIQECLLGSIVLTQKGIPGSILLIQDCMHTNSVCMHVVAKTKQKRQRPGREARTRERCPPQAGRAPRRSPQTGVHTRDSLFRSTKTNDFSMSLPYRYFRHSSLPCEQENASRKAFRDDRGPGGRHIVSCDPLL
jgi:hypothetical protein